MHLRLITLLRLLNRVGRIHIIELARTHRSRLARTKATKLVTIVNGLGNSILVGQRSAAQATVVVDYHVNQLFGGS